MHIGIGKPSDRVVLRDGASGDWLMFRAPQRVLVARRMDEVVPLLREAEEEVNRRGWCAAGFVAYESARAFDSSLPYRHDPAFPLAWFGLYQEACPAAVLPGAGERATPLPSWRATLSPDEFRRCLLAIRECIAAGDTYQVNFTHRLRAAGFVDPWAFFLEAMARAAAPYAAYLDTGEWAVCSASPELFFRLDGERIESRPMKGTAARGLWYEDDAARRAALGRSEKDRAENVMIVDMVRNDLGRIARTGSVEAPSLFEVEKYPTVWQMTSTVRAQTSASLAEIFQAAFPPASVTGAPKRRTMEIIAELESSPRRAYTGAIGFLLPGRCAQFSVAIRTALFRRPGGEGEYGVGGGIVWDSDPAAEWEECWTKAKVLRPAPHDFDLLETMLWTPPTGYSLLEYHLRRLAHSADYFGFPFDVRGLRRACGDIAVQRLSGPWRVRLLVTRRGAFRFEAEPCGPAPLSFADLPLALTPINAGDPFLYHKTTYRRVYEEKIKARPGSEDVLLFNEAGEVTESTVANAAFEIDGVLCTPPVRCGLLPGTYRAWLLDRGRLRERVVTLDEALRCAKVFLMNSVRGLHPVRIVPA